MAKISSAQRLNWVFADTVVLIRRNLIRYRRLPQLIVFSTIQPVMFLLLFNFVFGGAISRAAGGIKYINFLLPGILVQTMVFGATATTVGLAEDLSKGIIERFKSLPMWPGAVLTGRVFADTIRNAFVATLMLTVGLLLGFRFHNGILPGILGIMLGLLFGFAFSWISALIGLSVKNPEAAQSAGFIWIFPLVFASSIFVPVTTMPGWLQAFANNQPITHTVNAVRALMLGGALWPIWYAVGWCVLIIAIFMPLAVRAFLNST